MINNIYSKTKNTNSFVWSPGGSKIAMPFRLGDVMLLEKDVVRREVKGVITDYNEPLSFPSKVKIVSESSNLLWTTAIVDSLGHYEAKLPEGTYQVSSAAKNVNVVSSESNGAIQKVRLDEYKNVIFEVSAISINMLDTLKLNSYSTPGF
jgi:hypothetical protein